MVIGNVKALKSRNLMINHPVGEERDKGERGFGKSYRDI